MGTLFIPPLDTVVKLAQDWEFDLYAEQRNKAYYLIFYADAVPPLPGAFDDWRFWGDGGRTAWANHRPLPSHEETKRRHTITAGTELIVDRIYIRRGNADFDSVTFKFAADRKKRFWAKLRDVNRMVVE
jgi:hypothetical protein